MASVYIHNIFLKKNTLHIIFFKQKKLQNTDKFLHITIFYTQNLLDTIRFFKIKNRETFLYIIRKGIAVPKLELDAKAKKNDFVFFKGFLKGKIPSAEMEKICCQITVAALMQLFHYYDPIVKNNRIYACSHGTK
jgi:hypothetical protein